MFTNKCMKCGSMFETKNPKRVICPNCLYAEKKTNVDNSGGEERKNAASYSSSYISQSQYEWNRSSQRKMSSYSTQGQRSNNLQRRQYSNVSRDIQGYKKSNTNNGARSFNRKPPQRFNKNKRQHKELLVTKEQLLEISNLYKPMLPLPNPDAHEVISQKVGIESRKVLFAINLIRQKLMLPKISFPKRKLALTPEQLIAIKTLYEPLLPLPPIGCHKIISAQLRIDEWRVYVGIGLVRKELGLEKWNEGRDDAPKGVKYYDIKEKRAQRKAKEKEQREMQEKLIQEESIKE